MKKRKKNWSKNEVRRIQINKKGKSIKEKMRGSQMKWNGISRGQVKNGQEAEGKVIHV